MPSRKKAVDTGTKASTIQLWYGENQSLLEVELGKWVTLFRAKYPAAQVRRFEYVAGAEGELAQAVHQAVSGGGMFAQKILVVLSGALAVDAKSELGELLLNVCSAPPKDLVLVLAETKKVAWSKPLAKALKKLVEEGKLTLKEFANLSSQELEQWIVARAKEEGGKLGPSVARLLAQAVGNDFFALAQEIAKLTAYRGGEEVRAVDIDELVAPKLQDDVFVFLDAVGRRDLRAANQALARQFAQGASPQSLVGLLAWHVRVLALVREALDGSSKRAGSRELAQELGLHPFVVTKTLQQIPYYSTSRIAWLYDERSNLDVKLKS
ncbi:MAG: DNA polymerase III subunit delta, partial [Candidatus Veblenbacteria bacterium]|nr:DNA polymerase III subunit delta [Candidatus Veblenbacteria bacterium]